ncbi:sulfur oxidation c-type cytochrome SoxX [Paracoccus sp. Z330]|uniref:Sulfur oxidation c-type cytochrome SoxX n=1 Tax=Paracoccus onchidii TaxID=3017813 RepID=A0ABT4ZDP6_9RHOB|nr:sulfur oxidation c-type cytochrome SoxX [Paracoccus onchidii]MDB6176836.1 sulfur oxidation c-type cytochrome SoxX [Paracoccus onchidii]
MPRQAVVSAVAVFAALALTWGAAAEIASQDVIFADDGSIAQSLSGQAGDAEQGARIYADKSSGNCVACHAIADRTDAEFQGTIGPALDGAGDRWAVAQLRGIVADAKQTFPESMMPSLYKTSGYVRPGDGFTGKSGTEPLPTLLSAQQIEDVVAYLATLKE